MTRLGVSIVGFHLILGSFAHPAGAVIDGHRADLALSADDQVLRAHTVRFVTRVGKKVTFCSGVKLDARTVLTAAHCLNEGTAEAIARGISYVQAYDADAPNQRRSINVSEVMASSTADIAVIHLKDDLPGSQSLPMAYGDCDIGSPFTAAGFGVTEKGKVSRSLRSADYVPSDSEAMAYLASLNLPKEEVENTVSLTAAKHAFICGGDSGGPVFCRVHGRLAIAGVISATASAPSYRPQSMREACGKTEPFLAYAPVTQNMNFIEAARSAPSTNQNVSTVSATETAQ